MKVRIAPAAQVDLDRHIDWLSERSPAAAQKAGDVLLSRLRSLSEFPESGAKLRGNLHKLIIGFGRDGFVAYYRVQPDGILIERVWHGLQNR